MKKIFFIASIALVTFSCRKNNHDNNMAMEDVIYLENNDFHDNQNAIIAYRNTGNGTLVALPGSPYSTGGAGIANPKQGLGPDDSDTQLKLSSDGKFLLAVNPGSNTIAVFRIQSDGGLIPVYGSPFNSGGQTPVSIDVRGRYVFVACQGGDPLHASEENPGYVTLTIDDNGKLSIVPDSKYETTAGSSPSQVLVAENGKFVFAADFLGFMLSPVQGTLRSFNIAGSGKLNPVSGTPYTIPGTGGALGLWQHPQTNVLYVGFPLQAKIGIYNIESGGALDFQSTVDAGPAACWLRTTKDGNYLYALNSGENTISYYNSSNANHPSSIGKIALKQPGPDYTAMGLTFTTSEDFALAFSPDETYLYVISQFTNPDFSIGNYNYLHTLNVSGDGSLTEPDEPTQIPVDPTLRPQGLVIVKGTFMKEINKMN